mmetsp:Transcript_73212/g.174497  ORF Transcript_73212/g.174497 Transcript_73212/m.174497 type:complete len:360 (+) Transcript_73212:144-1223(+)|eukprot:CAMPEP_0178417054 /NCGR_PEP_ID=MMETSP0689_2-20121128/24380_1 /TAXON_ID=160604 /ORGANISM="Amphidinium massartii, Strain CS-259" /LENGTH=359 /DNA_ID=CAMNT_0020038415 /DNA_START=56 /DNA_END=1135 /DNA_ORIENTATION=+
MILYDSKGMCISLRNLNIIVTERQIWIGIAFAIPSALIAFALKTFEEVEGRKWFRNDIMDRTIYSALNFFACFVVIFRIESAYSRFFTACEKAYNISGNMLDLFSLLMAFCRTSKAPQKDIRNFQQTLIRLMSLLNAAVYRELKAKKSSLFNASDFEVIDLDGLDEHSLTTLKSCDEDIVQVGFQWLQALVIDNMVKGVLNVPPPILTRVYQESGAGMVKFHEGLNVVLVPYPFPFATTTEVLLIIQSCTLPVVIIEWTGYRACACGFCFILVFLLWFFNMVAAELENPFIGNNHSLDMKRMQASHNAKLLAILRKESSLPPAMSTEAKKDADDTHAMLSMIGKTKFGSLLREAALSGS